MKICPEGTVCRLSNEDLSLDMPLLGATYHCLQPYHKEKGIEDEEVTVETKVVSEGERCYQAIPSFKNGAYKCPEGFVCRQPDSILDKFNGRSLPGASSICARPWVSKKVESGQVCYQSTASFGNMKECPEGEECRLPDDKINGEFVMLGAELLCLPVRKQTEQEVKAVKKLKLGDTCYQSTATFGAQLDCPIGLECRLDDVLLKLEQKPMGAPLKCLPPYGSFN